MKKIKLIVFMLFSCAITNAQSESELDGVYTKSKNNLVRTPVPYTSLRERDIFWSKRIWRIIDMKQKQNLVFYYPTEPDQGRKNLMSTIMAGVSEIGNMTAYNPDINDLFTQAMTVEEVLKDRLTRTVSIQKFNEVTGEMENTEKQDTIQSYDITRFELKEETFFDKQKSVLETRILGFCPLVEEYRDGEFVGYKRLFWVYFPEARPVLVQNDVYNTQNDAQRLTYDDIFWSRMFSSIITKESNVYNRKISQYKSPLDAILEAEIIEEKIFNFEHDLWSY